MALTFSETAFIVYGCLYFLGAVIATVYSYIDSKAAYKFTDDTNLKQRIKHFLRSFWSKKRMYAPMIVHIFDTASDAGVLVEWFILSRREQTDHEDSDPVPYLNMTAMFWCNLGSILLYRLLSTIWVYRLTVSISQAVLQFFDLLLFKAIYVCYKLKRTEPSNPQMFLQKLEGVFESTPQALLQLVYSLRRGSFTDSPIVTISFFFSLVTLSMRSVSDDQVLFQDNAKGINFKESECGSLQCVSWGHIRRVLFRVIDISHRIMLMSLFWIVCGGFPFAMLMAFESAILIGVAIYYRSIIVLQGSVTTLLEFQGTLQFFSIVWTNSRFYVENAVLVAVISAFLYNENVECWQCISYDERRQFVVEDSFGFTIYVVTLSLVLLLPVFFYLIQGDFYEYHRAWSIGWAGH